MMAHFYFHLHDRAGFTPDDQGRECEDLEQVSQAALKEARALICADVETGVLDLGARIEVADGRGHIVHRLLFRDAVSQ
jgi:hypothetical protein